MTQPRVMMEDAREEPMTEEIEIQLNTPNGPRVEYGPDDDAVAVTRVATEAGFSVDFSNQVELASGRYRAPLVR